MTKLQPATKQWSQNPELTIFMNFTELQKKTELLEKFKLLGKKKKKRIKRIK